MIKSLLTPLFPLALLVVSCASLKQEDQEKEKPKPQTQIVGIITSVSSTSGFVLLQKYGAGSLPAGGLFQTLGEDGRTGSIRPSGERVRDFFAADILHGNIKVGDAVFHRILQPLDQEQTETTDQIPNTPVNPTPDAETTPSTSSQIP